MTSNEQNNDNNWNWGDLIEGAGGVSSVVKLLSLLKNKTDERKSLDV